MSPRVRRSFDIARARATSPSHRRPRQPGGARTRPGQWKPFVMIFVGRRFDWAPSAGRLPNTDPMWSSSNSFCQSALICLVCRPSSLASTDDNQRSTSMKSTSHAFLNCISASATYTAFSLKNTTRFPFFQQPFFRLRQLALTRTDGRRTDQGRVHTRTTA